MTSRENVKANNMKLKSLAFASMTIAVVTVARAQTGTLGLVDITTPTVSPGTDINGATTYSIGDLASFSNESGFLTGLPSQNYGAVSFQPAVGSSFSFGSAMFGTFTSTAITLETSTAGFQSMHILGDYSSGSFDNHAVVNDSASVDLSFAQNPIATGGISDSAVFSVPATVIPEPTSLAMVGVGVGTLSLRVGLRRRQA